MTNNIVVRLIAYTKFLGVPPEMLNDEDETPPSDTDQGSDIGRLIECAGRECYDEETELLTDQGWKRFSNLDRSEQVATLNPETKEIEYQLPSDYIIKDVDEDLFYIDGRRLNCLVTKNHQMFVGNRDGSRWSLCPAHELNGNLRRFWRVGKWKGRAATEFFLPASSFLQGNSNQYGSSGTERRTDLPELRLPIAPFLCFLGYYITEGFFHREANGHHLIVITQRKEGMEPIETAVKQLGFSYRIVSDPRKPEVQHLKISNKQLCDYLSVLGKSHSKHVPRHLLDLDSDLLHILYEAMIAGDGGFTGRIHRNFYTVSKQLADDMQELALKTGKSMSVRYRKINSPGKKEQFIWSCSENTRPSPVLDSNVNQGMKRYTGKVYCVTVPEHHIIYVRRNGIPMWCGNCYDSYRAEKHRPSDSYHQHIKEVGHGSVTGHGTMSFYISGVSRNLTHELVRHAMGCEKSQRSSRYCDESTSPIAWHPLLYQALNHSDWEDLYDLVESNRNAYCLLMERCQSYLLSQGVSKLDAKKQARGAARGILPSALSTGLVWTVNIRALRYILEQRCQDAADAEIRLLMCQIFPLALAVCPEYFNDYELTPASDGMGACLKTAYRKI